MGVYSETESVRKLVELQGWMNQYIAKNAHKIILMIPRIPIIIKSTNEHS